MCIYPQTRSFHVVYFQFCMHFLYSVIVVRDKCWPVKMCTFARLTRIPFCWIYSSPIFAAKYPGWIDNWISQREKRNCGTLKCFSPICLCLKELYHKKIFFSLINWPSTPSKGLWETYLNVSIDRKEVSLQFEKYFGDCLSTSLQLETSRHQGL